MKNAISLDEPKLARVADAAAIHALLWSDREAIPLKDRFNTEETRDWIRQHCKMRRFWVVKREDVIVAAMLLKPAGIMYLITDARFRREGWAFSFYDMQSGSAMSSRLR